MTSVLPFLQVFSFIQKEQLSLGIITLNFPDHWHCINVMYALNGSGNLGIIFGYLTLKYMSNYAGLEVVGNINKGPTWKFKKKLKGCTKTWLNPHLVVHSIPCMGVFITKYNPKYKLRNVYIIIRDML